MINEADILRLKKEKAKLQYIRKDRIADLLEITPEDRSPEDSQELVELLVEYPCFQAVAEHDMAELVRLTKELYVEHLPRDMTIIKQGDEPDKAYVIISGHMSVFVTFKIKKFEKVKEKTI